MRFSFPGIRSKLAAGLLGIAFAGCLGIHSLSAQPLTWNELGPGLYGPIHAITINGNDVYVGGSFLNAGDNPDADYIARWDGCAWHALGPGLNGEVKAILVSGSDVYVGGSFTQPFSYIARWDGVQWNAVGSIPGNTVNALVKQGGNIIAGGGEWNSGFVAQWNGAAWTTIGPSFNGQVNDLVVSDGALFAGGRFTDVGGNPDADGVIKWADNAWQNLGLGIYADIYIGAFDLEPYAGDLYVGGIFASAGGNSSAHKVVKWDGVNWMNIGAGLIGFLGLHALTIYNGSLYTTVGAGYANNDGIYRWDFSSETWQVFQVMELGPDDPLLVLTAEGSSLYVGGYSGMFIEGIEYIGPARYGLPVYPGIVTSTEDHGPGSLRERIACASNGDTITFLLPPSSQIILTSGEIRLEKNVTLMGPGITDLMISGNNTSRIFHLLQDKNATVKNMALKNGAFVNHGGAILNQGNLVLDNVLLQNNYQNGSPKALTLAPGSMLTIKNLVQCKL